MAAGAGVAALAAGSHKNSSERAQKKAIEEKARAEYRNTERGKHEKNSKGIYYTNGNYEAFARPEKPEGVDEKVSLSCRKRSCFTGSGLLPCKRRHRCRVRIFIFLRLWISPVVPATVSMTLPEAM